MELFKNRRIGIVIFPDAQALDIIGPHEVFSLASRYQEETGAPKPYEVFLIASDLNPVKMSSGMKIQPDYQFKDGPFHLDTLIVPGSSNIQYVMDNQEIFEWVKQQADQARRLVSICTGAFFLARAGLLEGKKATTHWYYCKTLQEKYPELEVNSNAIYIQEGNIYTSGGVTSGIDLSLALVEEDLGKEMAMDIARNMVIFYKRPGGQNQFSTFIISQSNSYFQELIDWIGQNLTEDLTVERLAERVGMSPRNFARVFKKERKDTPAKFIEKIRLQNAKMLLEDEVATLEEIADQCDFKSEERMRRAFQKELRITPREYRTRF